MDVSGRSFGRAITEITGLVPADELLRRARQRESLVSALEEQVHNKEVDRTIGRLRQWDEDRRELILMGLPGAGKPRPTIPPELLPAIQRRAPDLLLAEPERLGGAAPSAHALGRAPALTVPSSHAGMHRDAVSSYASAASASLGVNSGAGAVGLSAGVGAVAGVEARLDSVLRTIAPGLVERVAAAADAAGAAAAVEAANAAVDAGDAGDGAGERAGLGAIATLLQELLEEQKRLREKLERVGTGAAGRPAPNKSTGLSSASPPRGSGGTHRAAFFDVSRGRGVNGDGSIAPDRRRAPAALADASLKNQQSPPHGRGATENVDTAAQWGHGGAPGTGLPPKRPVFGRHSEGALTAEQRRQKGEARAADAAARRREALEEFRAASEANKAIRRREAQEQKGLRRQLAFDRGGALRRGQADREDASWDGPLDSVLASGAAHLRDTSATRYASYDDAPPASMRGGGMPANTMSGAPSLLRGHHLHTQHHTQQQQQQGAQQQHQFHSSSSATPAEDADLAHTLGHVTVELPSAQTFMAVPAGMLSPPPPPPPGLPRASGAGRKPAAGGAVAVIRSRGNSIDERAGQAAGSRVGSNANSRVASRESLRGRIAAHL